MSWNPMDLIRAAEDAGVQFDVDDAWLDVNPYGKSFQPVGVIWHHTATGTWTKGDMPSLSWCRFPGEYSGEARACHIVVGRSGRMQIIAGMGAYHAGAGGPLKVQNTSIPKDVGNRFLLGIEIEASSTTKILKTDRVTPKSGMTPSQFEATAKFCAALFDRLGWDTSAAIRHKDWAPGRKIDVGIELELIRLKIDSYRKFPQVEKPKPTKKPTVVSLANVKPRKKNEEVRLVQEALKKEFPHSSLPVSGLYNKATEIAYKSWQKKCGYTGDDADGIPGRDSLTKLGKKYGFKVR